MYFPAYFDITAMTSYLDGHINRVSQIKLVSFAFDIATAVIAYYFVGRLSRSSTSRRSEIRRAARRSLLYSRRPHRPAERRRLGPIRHCLHLLSSSQHLQRDRRQRSVRRSFLRRRICVQIAGHLPRPLHRRHGVAEAHPLVASSASCRSAGSPPSFRQC